MISFLRYTKLFLKGILFIPHLMILDISRDKFEILKEVNRSIMPTGFSYRNHMALLWLLENDKYYRKFFYYRIGKMSTLVN